MPDTADDQLIDRLVAAAERAIRAEGPGLLWERHRLRSVTIVLNLTNGGQVVSGETFCESGFVSRGEDDRRR